jgi:hypothetical protein
MALVILSTSTFDRVAKKLQPQEKKALDDAVNVIAADPLVFKFRANKQQLLLAYQLRPDKIKPTELVLISFGSYENFYRNLKGK